MFKSFPLSPIIKGTLLALGIAFVLSLLYSLLLAFTPVFESASSFNLILGLSIFCGAAFSAYQTGTKGLYYGLVIGTSVLLFLLLLAAILLPTFPPWISLGEKALICWIVGGIGGIIGVIFHR